jgi:tetratricopeptide (TPR) repeat protein
MTFISSKTFSILYLAFLFAVPIAAQSPASSLEPFPPKPSQLLSERLQRFQTNGSRSSAGDRESAYAALLEAQRYIWSGNPARGTAGTSANLRRARSILQKSLELDPTLSEAYTALAELFLISSNADIDEAIALAQLAVKTRADSFGGHRILARLYTYKSKVSGGSDSEYTQQAIKEWLTVARLDPKNAEAWAFLSEFYGNSGESEKQIDALQKWVGSAAPLDSQFYQRMTGGRSSLSPESATLQLASTLIKSGRSKDAVEVIGQLVADDPENPEAVDLLREAVETSDSDVGAKAANALEQAVYANPNNTALIDLLAHSHFRSGKIDEAASILNVAIGRLSASDKVSAAALSVSLGEIYFGAERYDDALRAFESAITIKGIKFDSAVGAGDREFLLQVLDKMVRTYKTSNHTASVPVVLQRAEKMLGPGDPFVVRERISYLLESGNKAGALQTVRAARVKAPNDYSLIRLEASVLTDTGRVEEAVKLIRGLVAKKLPVNPNTTNSGAEVSPMLYDDFSNLLFVSQLYARAKKGSLAVAAANEAHGIAGSAERRQIAKLSLATAQEMTGSFTDAELTLRGILKESPGNPIALNNLGYFLVERNERLDEAVTLVKKALTVDPNNPSYIDSLGWAYFKLGKFIDAEKSLRSAVRFDSGSATIHEHLGDVLNKLGRQREARQSWQRALVLASESEDVTRIRAKLK